MSQLSEDIRHWYNDALGRGATHLVVIYDPGDDEYIPFPVFRGQAVRHVATDNSNAPRQRLVAVYNLSLNKEQQLREKNPINY